MTQRRLRATNVDLLMHRILAFAVLITFASIATATNSQKRLVRGLWSLTTQANRIELADVQRVLALQPSHYDVQESKDLADPWPLIYILKEKYRNDTEGTDPVNAIYFGQIQLVVLEGPPPDV
jgi:hypothetical protein